MYVRHAYTQKQLDNISNEEEKKNERKLMTTTTKKWPHLNKFICTCRDEYAILLIISYEFDPLLQWNATHLD